MRHRDFLRTFGKVDLYSPGTAVIMADRQIESGISDNKIILEDIGNSKTVVRMLATGKWFIHAGGIGNDRISTAMLGAVCGDVIGSVYEWHNIKYKPDTETLVHSKATFTDDTVMTCAVAHGLCEGLKKLPRDWMLVPEHEKVLTEAVTDAMVLYGRRYPNAGYGGHFKSWIFSEEHKPYKSWGNGSAMRASYAGWAALTLEEAERLAEICAMVTHDHPDGIAGAKAVAGSILLLRSGASKKEVYQYVSKFYNLDFTLDEIRDEYRFDVSCKGSVPHAIVAFLENDSFADIIAAAISIGGDSDTIAAIAGSLAEVIYPIPQSIRGDIIDRLDDFLKNTIVQTVDFFSSRL